MNAPPKMVHRSTETFATETETTAETTEETEISEETSDVNSSDPEASCPNESNEADAAAYELFMDFVQDGSFDSDTEVGAASAGGPPGYNTVEFHIKMTNGKHLYKLTDDGIIVGGAILFKDGDKMNVGRIFVDSQHLRKGYGLSIMQQIEEQFPDVCRFTLDTPLWNVRTNNFYRKLGYTEYKRDNEFAYYIKQSESR